jgi:glycosyltransferase involved in cell wall biosynthesis
VSAGLSVVIPFHNEVENVPALARELAAALARTGAAWEVVMVDDGSTDGTPAALAQAAAELGRARVVTLGRNFGQSAALAAGIEHARGEVLVTLDGDGQNDPADIPRLLERLSAGMDVASGWRKDRRDPFLSRTLPSRLANGLIGWVTGVRLHDHGCTLKAYRAEVAKRLPLYGEMHRFLPVLAWQMGAKVEEVPVNHRPRLHGASKYGLGRTFRVALDLLALKFLGDFSTKPLRIFGGIGAVFCAAGTAAAAVTLWQKLHLRVWVHRNPLLLVAVFLFTLGVHLFLMGLLAELLVRSSREPRGRPAYWVRSVTGPGA